jgi:hypothetical protein
VADPENFDLALEDHISGEVGERVRAIISAAESAAMLIRQEAEQEVQSRKRLAEGERARYLDAARQEADALLRQRVERMSELSDSLIEGAERLLSELDDAGQLRRQLDRVVGSLARSAEELAAESRSFATNAVARPRPVVPEPEPVERSVPSARVEPVREPEPEPVRQPEPVREPEPEPVVAEAVIEEEPVARPVEAVREPEPDPEPEPVAEAPRRLRAATAEERLPNGDSPDGEREKDDDTLAARLVALQMAVAGSPRGEVEEHLRVTFALDDTTSILNDVFGTEAPRFAR